MRQQRKAMQPLNEGQGSLLRHIDGHPAPGNGTLGRVDRLDGREAPPLRGKSWTRCVVGIGIEVPPSS